MKNPKVSVCIPTYNYGRYLPEAIESVLNQTYTDFELLVLDDASQDDTESIVQSYVAKDSRIRYVRNSTNVGMVNNWNRCLELATGKYIKYLFGDDVFSSSLLLEKMTAILESDASISLVSSSRTIIDENSRQIDICSFYSSDIKKDGKEVINTCLLQLKNFIGEPTVVMFRKSQALRGFDTRFKQIVDLEMWFHLLEQGFFAYIDGPLCSFRIHDKQQTLKNKYDTEALDDGFRLIDEYLDKEYACIDNFWKMYIRYENSYRIWKMYKTGNINRALAVDKISTEYSFLKFAILYPVYKMIKPCLKLFRSLCEFQWLSKNRAAQEVA